MAEIHVAVSISWMGHTKKQTHTKNKKKHDDMLSCCATKYERSRATLWKLKY